MDNRKFEQLIDMIINENEEQARELFHEIVVEKSRQIYESMMDEDLYESGDMVGDLMSEVEADERMMEADDEFGDEDMSMDDDMADMDDDEAAMDDDMADMDDDMADIEGDEEDLEDRVVDLEDKLDELMAEFEAMMGEKDEDEDMGDEDMEDEEAMMEARDKDDDKEMDESVMEAVELKKVSVTHGDNGVQTKSTVSKGPRVPGNGAAPVKFSAGSDEKGRSAPSTKDVDHASKWQNAAGKDMAKMGKAPAPTKSQAAGSNTKDVVPGN